MSVAVTTDYNKAVTNDNNKLLINKVFKQQLTILGQVVMTTVILPRGFWWILDFSKLLISGQVPKSRKNCGEEEDEKKAIPKCCAFQGNAIKCGHVVY